MNEANLLLSSVFVLIGLSAVMLVAAVVYLWNLRLPPPPVPRLERRAWFAYRVLLTTRRRRRLWQALFIGLPGGVIIQALLGTRHVGWAPTALAAGRGLALGVAVLAALLWLVTSPDILTIAVARYLHPRAALSGPVRASPQSDM